MSFAFNDLCRSPRGRDSRSLLRSRTLHLDFPSFVVKKFTPRLESQDHGYRGAVLFDSKPVFRGETDGGSSGVDGSVVERLDLLDFPPKIVPVLPHGRWVPLSCRLQLCQKSRSVEGRSESRR